MATHVSSTNKYVRLLVMTKQSKLNIYLNLPAKLMVCHTPFKSTMEKMERGVVMMYQMVPVKVILQFTNELQFHARNIMCSNGEENKSLMIFSDFQKI